MFFFIIVLKYFWSHSIFIVKIFFYLLQFQRHSLRKRNTDFSNDIRYKREKSVFFQGVFHPLKVRMGTYKKIRVTYFCLENNILFIKIREGQLDPFPCKLYIFLM